MSELVTVTEEFPEFPKIARLSREIVITEKIDGTNGLVQVSEDGTSIMAGSRTRWVTVGDDNAGFAAWVVKNYDELLTLGPGKHYGEWWGQGIQRKYGMAEKVFSLFNTHRWCLFGTEPKEFPSLDPRITNFQTVAPKCCRIVPVLYQGPFNSFHVDRVLAELVETGSVAAPGFMNPEGIVVYHTAARMYFKKTVEKDEEWKGKAK